MDAIERALTYLGLSEQEGMLADDLDHEYRNDGDLKLPLMYFDGAEPFYGEWLDDTGPGQRPLSHERLYVNASADEEWRELRQIPLGNWSVTTLREGIPDAHEEYGKKALNVYCVQRHRKVPLSEVRGWPLKSFQVYEEALALVFADGTYRAQSALYELRGGDFWQIGFGPYAYHEAQLVRDEADVKRLRWANSMAFTNYYEWSVSFGWAQGNIPSIALACDPVGAKTAFRLRDVPTGKSRREALRHWVSEHWRRGKQPEDPATHIWPYLRGAETFTFNGLKCVIRPSQFDMKKAAEMQKRAGK